MQEFGDELEQYRLWRRIEFISFLFLLLIIIISINYSKITYLKGYIALLPIAALFCYSNWRVTYFRCPRCKKRFSCKTLWNVIHIRFGATSGCVHCGLNAYNKQ